MADGDRQRVARQLLRRAACTRRSRRSSRSRSGCWRDGARRASTSAASRRHRTARRSPPDEEIERVVPLIERIARELGVLVSVDTYKPAVAARGDRGGRERSSTTSAACATRRSPTSARGRGAALVADAHARGARAAPAGPGPLRRRRRRGDRVPRASGSSWRVAAGCRAEQLIVDPGPDFAKTPAQTIELLREAARLHELGRPLLMAISRKDFIGALTGRAPRERLRGHARGARARRSTSARTSSACTTSPRRPTSSRCARRCAARARAATATLALRGGASATSRSGRYGRD